MRDYSNVTQREEWMTTPADSKFLSGIRHFYTFHFIFIIILIIIYFIIIIPFKL
jgi:hypothetical protein